MFDVTNLHSRPVCLSDGVILAAHGTPGATRAVAALTGFDRRLVAAGLISVQAVVEKALPKEEKK